MSGPRTELLLFGNFPVGQISNPAFIAQSFRRSALLASEPHYRLPNGRWSGGGPFCMVRQSVHHTGDGVTDAMYGDFHFGPFHYGTVGGGGDYSVPTAIPSSWTHPSYQDLASDTYQYGARGYARTRPGNPVASLGQFLIELRDLPRLPFGAALGRLGRKGRYPSVSTYPLNEVPGRLLARLKDFRALGSEYLNVVFGWKPFVSDVRKLYNLWSDIDKRMAQIVRENGKSINRRAVLEQETTTEELRDSYPGAWRWIPGAFSLTTNSGSSQWVATRTTTTKVWYAANYRYYIPDVGSSQWTRRARLALFGGLPTPELLWSVLPWSWLIDWFGNVGDVISNLSPNAVDNLVQNYHYTMKHVKVLTVLTSTSVQEEVDFRAFGSWYWPRLEARCSSQLVTESKVRDGTGSPFGLNARFPSLSTYQLSILAALGASKVRKRRVKTR